MGLWRVDVGVVKKRGLEECGNEMRGYEACGEGWQGSEEFAVISLKH